MGKLLLATVGISSLMVGAMAGDATADDHMRGKMSDVKSSVGMIKGDIVDQAIASKDHTTLVAAVQAAGLVDTLKGKGPFTLFAPTNEAFGKLPAGTVEGLLKPESKTDLTKILTYHVIPGDLKAADLTAKIKADGGKSMVKTVQGEMLTASIENEKIYLTDKKGARAWVTGADLAAGNGVVHVIDTVLMP